MKNPRLDPSEASEVDRKGDAHRAKQPYASELDDRELEHAQKEKRPVSPSGKAERPEPPTRS
jgi:hypothetical protein